MTAARSTLSFDAILARIGNGLREGARWALRGILALAIIVMAGMFAVMTAIVGLVITGMSEEAPDLDDWSVLRLGLRRLMILWEAQKKRFLRRP